MATMQAEQPKKPAATMKAIQFHAFGGPEVLVEEDVPKPEAGAGQALVHIRAAGVNPVDWKVRTGQSYRDRSTGDMLPMISGVDMAGIVEAVGDDVTDLKPDDAVYGYLGVRRDGTYAQYVAADAQALAPKPQTADFVTAAALPLVSLVGWQTLFDTAHLEPGQTVLVHGAAGGVGHMAVQLAKWKGAKVIGTASARNADFLKSLEIDEVIDYHKDRFEEKAHNVDVVLDTIAGDTQRRSYQVLKKGGILVSTLGIEDPGMAEKYGVRATGFMARPNGGELSQIAELVDRGKLKPAVTEVMQMKDAAKAQALSESGHVHGKIVLKASDYVITQDNKKFGKGKLKLDRDMGPPER
jgi:NADPH:quinone reductase and related Zn-dependent oxidoreductases